MEKSFEQKSVRRDVRNRSNPPKSPNSLLRVLYRAAVKDVALSLPFMPLYSAAEVVQAFLATALIRLIYIDTPRVPVSTLVPEALNQIFMFPQTVDRKDLAFVVPLLAVGVGLFKLVTSFLSSYLMERAGYVVSTVLREELLKTVLTSSADRLIEGSSTELSNRLMIDTATMQGAVSKGALGGLRDFVVLVFCFSGMIFVAQKFLILVLLCLVPFVFFIRYMARIMQNYLRESAALQVELASHAMESVNGLLSLAAERNTQVRLKSFARLQAAYRRLTWHSLGRRTISGPFIEYIAVLGVAALLSFKNSLGAVDVASYASLFILGAMTYRPVKNLSGVLSQFSEIQMTYARINEIWKATQSQSASDEYRAKLLPEGSEKLAEAEAVSFVPLQKTEPKILHDASFSVARGEIIAFVGESGSGKTTALRILAGVFAPSAGELTCTPGVRLATQNPYVFKGLVSENVLYEASVRLNAERGAFEAKHPTEAVLAAGELLCDLGLAHSAMGAELFLDRHVGVRGQGLSGGEKARVALARVLASAGSEDCLLLFDEPTANLDPENARLFWQTLCKRVKSSSRPKIGAVVITHHRKDLVFCDRYYEFSSGKVTEGFPLQDGKL